MRSPEPSPCGFAMLAVIVDLMSGTSASTLQAAVPIMARKDLLPGAIESWPHDVSEWFDELQALLDAGLVERVAAEHKYTYEATERGCDALRAVLHPRGADMESVS